MDMVFENLTLIRKHQRFEFEFDLGRFDSLSKRLKFFDENRPAFKSLIIYI